jgi:exosortase A-associated hydrolase 1
MIEVNQLEKAVVFQCEKCKLTGVIHKPEAITKFGVLIVVGGPQYRVGSHRQFVLLARALVDAKIPVMRFDYRGMGDSEGEGQTFLEIDKDLASAIDTFYQECPDLTGVVIWGLCDAASAALFYGYQDDRVKGLILLNPWVFTEQGSAKTFLKYYYLKRLFNPHFWRKVFRFKFDYQESFKGLVYLIKKTFLHNTQTNNNNKAGQSNFVDKTLPLPERMKACLKKFNQPVLLILSGNDLTADEFREVVKSDIQWQELLKDEKIEQKTLLEADHTFSSALWREKVASWSLTWVNNL